MFVVCYLVCLLVYAVHILFITVTNTMYCVKGVTAVSFPSASLSPIWGDFYCLAPLPRVPLGALIVERKKRAPNPRKNLCQFSPKPSFWEPDSILE